MENVRVSFVNTDGTAQDFTPFSFRFNRERYTPYTQCIGSVIGKAEISAISYIELYYDDTLLHRGMADSVEKKYINGRYVTTFLSRSFTMLLGQNEPKPGIITNITLGSLISQNTSIPNVQWQATTESVNYIYVKEKSTIWDAICAYAYKAYENYPYIVNTNSVYVTAPETNKLFNYSNERLVTVGEKLTTSGILSTVLMCDTDGEYSYVQDNASAEAYDIVRKKYYALDRQWLSSPEEGLDFKLAYSNRGIYSKYLKYPGHKFENLMNKANCNINSSPFMKAQYISAVEVRGDRNGVFTTITVYEDDYA